ncbi:hypothetical protein PINS_up009245 [Pythium insidiosum]|nr:hypothetical protein PINS_up009245 [Pythium insidiosum]
MSSLCDLLDELILPEDPPSHITKHEESVADEELASTVSVWLLARDGDARALEERLEKEPTRSINARNPTTGRSLLHEASAEGQREVVKLLLSYPETNLSLKTMLGGSTALHLAVTNNHRPIVFQLLSNGADARARDKFGCTPMHYVSSRTVARVLVEYGGRVLDYNTKRRNALQSVAILWKDRIEEHEVDQAETEASMKELLKYLKERGDEEYKARLARLRELKRAQKEAQRQQESKRKKTRKTLSSASSGVSPKPKEVSLS